jgi:prepilin-type N-terminal cleavage/methylation domain-containing protein
MTTRAAGLNRGFTMVELALVLLIVTLVSAGLLRPIGLYIEQQKIKETRETLETAKEALINFALLNKRLPCPDTTGDGVADPCPACANPRPVPPPAPPAACDGWIPFAELRVPGQDAWGNRIDYQVSQDYANNTGITLASDSTINLSEIVDLPSNPLADKTDRPLSIALPAILVSHGPDGFGARKMDGSANAMPPAQNFDELENIVAQPIPHLDDHWHVRDRTPDAPACSDSAIGSPYCEFDDILMWISPNVLKSRMVQAGRLP